MGQWTVSSMASLPTNDKCSRRQLGRDERKNSQCGDSGPEKKELGCHLSKTALSICSSATPWIKVESSMSISRGSSSLEWTQSVVPFSISIIIEKVLWFKLDDDADCKLHQVAITWTIHRHRLLSTEKLWSAFSWPPTTSAALELPSTQLTHSLPLAITIINNSCNYHN